MYFPHSPEGMVRHIWVASFLLPPNLSNILCTTCVYKGKQVLSLPLPHPMNIVVRI